MSETSMRVTNPNRRRLVIGAVIACVALPTFFLLTRGNAQTNPQPFTPPGAAQAPAPSQPHTQTTSNHPIETFQVFAPRDPFQPVVVGAATGSSSGSAGSAGSSGTSDATGSTTGSSSSTAGSASSDGTTSVTGHRVKLIDTFTQGGSDKARIEVDGTVYTVAEGETFATNFKLLSIENKCITAFYGDDQFSLCEGEEILK